MQIVEFHFPIHIHNYIMLDIPKNKYFIGK